MITNRRCDCKAPAPWHEPALIPNREGYRVIVQLHDGTERTTRVLRDDATGLHSLDGVAINTVKCWRFDRYE